VGRKSSILLPILRKGVLMGANPVNSIIAKKEFFATAFLKKRCSAKFHK